MPVHKLTQVTVQGLATNPNPNALPAGSCAVLNNATMRKPGVIAPMATFATVVNTTVANGRKLLFNEVTNKNVIVYAATDGLNGKLQSFSLTKTTNSLDTIVTQLPSNMSGTKRNLAFLPGRTQCVTSHFRHLITEKSGVVVNQERWAGLPPPLAFQVSATSSTTGFLLDTQSVAYRGNFTLESTDNTKPYIVNGPVGAIIAVTNDTGNLAYTTVTTTYPTVEPLVAPTGFKLYMNIYRSSQAVVTTVGELAQDFRLVIKFEVVGGTPNSRDVVSDTGRDAGEPLYTNNIGQFGDQASNFAPPSSNDICIYKDTVFYANRKSYQVLTLTIPGALGQLQSAKDRLYGIGERPFVTATTTNGSANITFTDVGELTGVVAGQRIVSAAFAANTTVVSVNVGTLTVVASAVSAHVGSVAAGSFQDRITVSAAYETLTTATATTDVLTADYDLGIAGVRVLHGAVDITHEVFGRKLLVQSVWNAVDAVDSLSVYVTNGQNYSPPYEGNFLTKTLPLVSIGDTRPNRLFFSRTGEPEACPLSNYIDVGSGTIVKMWANQSALLVTCTDGLWKVTGDGTDFTPYQLDPTARLVHPDCLTSLNNVAYGWITDGLAKITEDGATTISTDAIGPAIRALYKQIGTSPIYNWGYSLAGDSLKNEIWFSTVDIAHELIELSFGRLYNDDSKNFSSFSPVGQGMFYDFAMYTPVIGQMVFVVATIGGGATTYLLSPSDSYSAGGAVATTYLPLTVWFNPLQTEDKGNLKQFIDLNYFTTNLIASPVAAATNSLKAFFNAKGEASDPTGNDVNVRNMAEISRDVHYFVPRRTALSDQQQIGLLTITTVADSSRDDAFYVEIQGFTVRYRIASQTLKR